MTTDSGRALSGQALVASDQAASRLAPTGFDPSRWSVRPLIHGNLHRGWQVWCDDRPITFMFDEPSDAERAMQEFIAEAIAMEARQGTDPKGLDGEARKRGPKASHNDAPISPLASPPPPNPPHHQTSSIIQDPGLRQETGSRETWLATQKGSGMSIRFLHITGSLIALGIISAITTAILYFMRLPIFDAVSLAWVFVVGLLSAAIAASTLAVRSIWSNGQ